MTETAKTREQLIEEMVALCAREAELKSRLPEELVRNFTRELRVPIANLYIHERLLRLQDYKDPERREEHSAALRRGIWQLEYVVGRLQCLMWMLLRTGSEPQPPLAGGGSQRHSRLQCHQYTDVCRERGGNADLRRAARSASSLQ